MKRFFIFMLSSLSLLACSSPEEGESAAAGKHEVTVAAGKGCIGTRTSLGTDGVSVSWSEGDAIALWAVKEDEFALAGERFGMKDLSDDASEATFSAIINDMEDGTYTYYASYPCPVSVEGGTAHFDLPAVQEGTYKPEYDIMTALPAEAASLLQHGNKPSLQFAHRMHIIRMYIPQEGNTLGEPIERITLTFPAPVAGQIEADMTTSAIAATGSNSITLELAEPIDADSGEALAFINPVEMSTEESFSVTVESPSGEASFDVPGRTLAAGHITPLKMKLPTPVIKEATLRFSVGEDHLGEPLQKLTLRGENVDVANGADEVVLDMTEGFADLRVTGKNSYLAGRTLEAVFESENAIVSGSVTIGNVEVGEVNAVSVTTPYLLFEDFSGVGSFSSNDVYKGSDAANPGAIDLAPYGLNGWTGARVGGAAGQGVRVMARIEIGLRVVATYSGRMDTAPLQGIKEGRSVNLKVEFDTGYEEYVGAGTGGAYVLCDAGYTTASGAIGGSTDIENKVNTFDVSTGGSYTSTPMHFSYSIPGGSSDTRISWRVRSTRKPAFAGNGCYWMYLGQVKVSIAH